MPRFFGPLIIVSLVVASATAAELRQYPGRLRDYFISMPTPEYPKSALRHYVAGKGWFELTIDFASGTVTRVRMLQSTGDHLLDDSAATALRHWRVKPRSLKVAIIPVKFETVSPFRTSILP